MKRKFLVSLMLLGCLGLISCGAKGPQGPIGETGQPGKDGIGIKSIVKTESKDNIDIYTITYTDGTTSNFIITNGENGEQGVQGLPGKDGHTPVITINDSGNWVIDGIDTGITAKGPKGDKGETGTQGPAGADGQDGQNGDDGLSAYEIYIKYHPEYTKTEEEWISDLVLGNLLQYEKFNVSIMNLDGTLNKTITTNYGTKIQEPDIGYQGEGTISWYVNGEKWNFNENLVKSDIVLEPKVNETKLTIACYENDENYLKYLISKFNEQRINEGKDELLYTLIQMDLRTSIIDPNELKKGPDLFQGNFDNIGELYYKNIFSPLPTKNAAYINENFSNYDLSYAVYDNKNICYPCCNSGYILYYDKTQVSVEEVASIESLSSKAASLNKKYSYSLDTPFYGLGAITSFGAKWENTLDKNGIISEVSTNFKSQAGIDAFDAIYKIASDKNHVENDLCPGENEQAPIATISGTWNYNLFKNKIGNKLGCAVLPKITVNGKTSNFNCFIDGNYYGVNSFRPTEKQELAHELANFLISEESQIYLFKNEGLLPFNKSIINSDLIKNNEYAQAFLNQKDHSIKQIDCPYTIWGAYMILYNEIKEHINFGKPYSLDFANTELTKFDRNITNLR